MLTKSIKNICQRLKFKLQCDKQDFAIGKETCLNVAVYSDVGLRRSNNEDNFLIGQEYNENSLDKIRSLVHFTCSKEQMPYFVGVFDGMGGGENGEVASLITAKEMGKRLEGAVANYEDIDIIVRKNFQSANNKIVKMQTIGTICGTTATVICFWGEHFKVYHLGDSRVYLLRNEELFQLTKDHTVAAMKLSMGLYEEGMPAIEKEKHQLTEYVGCDFLLEGTMPAESEWLDIRQGDKLLLCTDGLYDMCSDTEIRRILLSDEKADILAKKLGKTALKNGGIDNVTCICMTC